MDDEKLKSVLENEEYFKELIQKEVKKIFLENLNKILGVVAVSILIGSLATGRGRN